LAHGARRRAAPESDEKVETIANLVGYESLPAFSRAFTGWQGQSPANFVVASNRKGRVRAGSRR
jgi:AraC-like DNA-binding protein